MRTGIRGVPVLVMVIAFLAALGAVPRVIVAQDAPASSDRRFELVLGGPSAVGLIIPLSDRLSLRVDGTVGGSVSGVGDGAGIGPSSAWNYVVGVSALRYVSADAAVRPYLLARFGYQRSMPDGSAATSTFLYGVGGGAQARLADQVAVFSELSALFAYSAASSGAYSTTWNSTARVGISLRRAAAP